jgi:hypothetical protein
MGAEVKKKLADAKFKQTILDMILKLEDRRRKFNDLYRQTNWDVYDNMVKWIDNKIKELSELL